MTALPREAYRMRELEEARGQLQRVLVQEGSAVAIFSWGAVALPSEMESSLREHVGRKIGILRLEGYHVREVGP